MAVILPILTTFSAAGVRAAQASLTGFGGTLAKVAKTTAAAAVTMKALSGAIDFVGESIASARDLERNTAALKTVFKDIAPQMIQFTKNAQSMGISQVEAARTATFLGSVLKQAGFPMDEVASKTEKLSRLAQDLATTYGYDTSEALTAMTALFRGEYDPIEKFGVALKQNEVNALVAAKGLGHLTGQAMLNAQQQVRMEQLFLRSADAMGAYERQAGTLFVAQKNLNAVFENMKAAAGGPLTKVLAEILNTLNPLFVNLGPILTTAFASLGELMLTLQPLFAPLMDHLGILVQQFGLLAEILATALTPLMGPLADALNIVNQVFHFINDAIAGLMPLIKILIGGPLEMFALAWDGVAAALEGVLGFLKPITDGVAAFFGQFFPYLEQATNAGLDSIRRMREGVRGGSLGQINTDSNAAIAAAVAGFGSAKAGAGGSGASGTGVVKTAAKDMKKSLWDSFFEILKKAEETAKKIGEAFKATADGIAKSGDFSELGKNLGNQILDNIQAAFKRGAGYLSENAAKMFGEKFTAIAEKVAALQKKIIERNNYAKQIKDSILATFDFNNARKGIKSIVEELKNSVRNAIEFKNNLQELNKLGLNQDLYKKIVDNLDFQAARDLVAGGSDAIAQVNDLYGQLSDLGQGIGDAMGNSMFNLGVDMATGFIRTLEEGFGPLQNLFNVTQKQMGRAKAIASAEAEIRSNKQLLLLDPKNTDKYLQNIKDATAQLDKLKSMAPIRMDQSALTRSQLDANYLAYGAPAQQPTTNYTINVSGGLDTRSSIGQAVVEAIRTYERSSGQVFARV